MAGQFLERTTDEGWTVWCLAPLEERTRLRKYHALVSAIIGLGIDATDIPRIAATMERYGDRFIQRIFTDGEIAYCMRRRHPVIHFAGRFAAKEAAMKALGTGHTQNVLWRGVEVVRGGGPPRLEFHGGARRRFDNMGAGSSLLTITHSDSLAIAQVMLFSK
jgi:holo-[acyl-carrier protein] synthase